MLHSVKINGVDMKQQYGLVLLADLTIGAAAPKENYVDIPGGSGALDLSTAPGGVPTYANREISFNLFKRVTGTALELIRHELATLYHGQRVEVIFPTDMTCYYAGRLKVGALGEYGSGVIPFTMTADPYCYSTTEKAKTGSNTTLKSVTLDNGGQPVTPTITTNSAAVVKWNNITYNIGAGERQILPEIVLPHGRSQLYIGPGSGVSSVTFEINWREAYL